MKKKFLFGLVAATTMLFAASCLNEELDGVQSDNEAAVSFTIGVEGGVQTRDISDGSGADMLVYAVFDENDDQITALNAEPVKGIKFPYTVDITLAKGQIYKVAFWAQNSKCTAYKTDNLKAVTVDYSGIVNNDESRDAFFAAKEIEVPSTAAGSMTETVTLKRPFAQLNVGVTEENWQAAVSSTIEIEKSDVTISEVANTINLLYGSVSGEVKNLTYSIEYIPAERLKVDTDGDGTKEEYRYLSMSYLLPYETTTGALRTTVGSVEFNFYPKDGNVINLSSGLTNIPVQRNYRTNILGDLLTTDVTYNITIDSDYDDDIDATINASTSSKTIEELLEEGGVVNVAEAISQDIDFSKLELERDVYLLLEGNVPNIKLGGNNDGDITRSGALTGQKPNVIIELADGVAYPNLTFAYEVENYVIKGNDQTYTSQLSLAGKSVKNLIIDGVKFQYVPVAANNYPIQMSGATIDGLTVSNCVFADADVASIKIDSKDIRNVVVKNNTINCKEIKNSVDSHDQDAVYIRYAENVTVEGNTINNSMGHHGILLTSCKGDVVVTKNTINDAEEDAIKIDQVVASNVTVTHNTITTAGKNGIRFDNFHAEASDNFTAEITHNTISAACNDGYGINLKSSVAVNINLTAKNNKAKKGDMPDDRYFNLSENINATGDYSAPFIILVVKDLTSGGADVANCYIIPEAGSYTFPAIYKGNENTPSIDKGDIVYAEVLWESFGTSEAPKAKDLISEISYNPEDGWITFKATDLEGNALIAVKDDNEAILWSWHIWLTDTPQDQAYNNEAGTMMDRNLGATSATPSDGMATYGLFYQWGRKDPFISRSYKSGDDNSGNVQSVGEEWPQSVACMDHGTDEYATLHPMTFITANRQPYDWLKVQTYDDSRWNTSEDKKAVHDPCPSGYRVPSGGPLSYSPAGLWAVAFDYNGTFYGDDNINEAVIAQNKGVDFASSDLSRKLMDSGICWYPAAGYLENDGALSDVGLSLNYWSSTYRNKDYYNFVVYDRVYPANYYYGVFAMSVRCIKE